MLRLLLAAMSVASEAFVVSARKYRPAVWAEVLGQDGITKTLHNSIAQGQLAHAYLFCGPRGVGKTTCARIFAREINRAGTDTSDDFDFNILELDGASSNSVDNIRSLIDQVRIPPQTGTYKVYIIDEVHMLSTAAFNAFLKTLEEPPRHAIFILATTEKHKVLPTILSRCQVYDFNRIGVDVIADHLNSIAKKEGIECDNEALHVIAHKADGALRDALSIFDQLASFTGKKITHAAVLRILHVLDYEHYFALTRHLCEFNSAEVLLRLNEVLAMGFDAQHFAAGLSTHFRNLMMCRDERTAALLEVAEGARSEYVRQAASISPDWLLSALKLSTRAEYQMRGSLHQRLVLEVVLLEIAALADEKKKDPDRVAVPVAAAIPSPPANALPKSAPEPVAPTVKSEAAATELAKSPSEANSVGGQLKRHRTTSIRIDDEPSAVSEPAEVAPVAKTLGLAEAITKVKADMETAGSKVMVAILSAQHLQGNEQVLRFSLKNKVEEQEFNTHRTELLAQLRQLSGLSALTIEAALSEEEPAEAPLTPNDKFKQLAAKNPALQKLKSALDLENPY